MARKRKKKVFDQVELIDIASRGKCIGRTVSGEIVLVEDGVPGDVINGHANRKQKGLWKVRVDELIKPSPHRVQPNCQHFLDCGGCKWQHFDIRGQLRYKEKQVFETIKRIGEFSDFIKLPIVPSPRTFGFRNKMEFSFSNRRWMSKSEIEGEANIDKNGGLGLHPPGWYQKVVDLERCHLIPDVINAVRNFVRDESRRLGLSFYDAIAHEGDMRNLIMRINRSGQIMLTFVFGSEPQEPHRQLMEMTINAFTEITSVYSILNEKLNDSIYDLTPQLIHGNQYLEESIGTIQFKIGPKSFFQTNIYQTEQLYAEVKKLAELTGNEIVYDLYAGIGSIGLYIADQAKKVIAIEDVAEAVADARLNAELNGISHMEYHTGKMEELIRSDQLSELPKPDVIITDPPRAGMHAAVIEFILMQAPQRIVYVSCDPATQARDIRMLAEKYKLLSVQAFDMFPHTSHVEAVALLEKN